MRIVFRATTLAMILAFCGCGDNDELSPQVPDGAVVDAAVTVDVATADSSAGDTAVLDGALSDALTADALTADAQPIDTAPRPGIALLKAELAKIVTKPGHELASLAVLAIDNGKVSFEGHFGNAYINNATPSSNVPADANTLYRVASISKMVTAIGVMTLVDDGKVDLDADVSTYLGFQLRNPSFPTKTITTRMLLSHKSSLRDDGGYTFPVTTSLESVLTPLGTNYKSGAWAGVDVATSQAPGDHFFYVNLNFGVLGSVIEGASGQRFDKFMQAKVLAPLGIKGGYYPADFSAETVSRIATIYRKRDADDNWNPAGPWFAQADDFRVTPPTAIAGLDAYVLAKNGTLFAPQGSLRITIADMGKIMQMLLDNGKLGNVRILKPASVNNMQANEWTYNEAAKNGDNYFGLFLSWGLGTQRFTDTNLGDRVIAPGGFKGFGHLGDAYGLFSGFIYDPVTQDGLIYCIGGVGSDPEEYYGDYSMFYKWEEEILTTLHHRAVAHNAIP